VSRTRAVHAVVVGRTRLHVEVEPSAWVEVAARAARQRARRAFVRSTYSRALSIPIHCRPSFSAATAVVPLPMKGSRMIRAFVD
jgi:hypothetical protein